MYNLNDMTVPGNDVDPYVPSIRTCRRISSLFSLLLFQEPSLSISINSFCTRPTAGGKQIMISVNVCNYRGKSAKVKVAILDRLLY